MTNTLNLRRTIVLTGASLLAITVAAPAWADATAPCNVGPAASSTECGVNSSATDQEATAIGDSATASGLQSTAVGSKANASGAGANAVCEQADASGAYSTAVGHHST